MLRGKKIFLFFFRLSQFRTPDYSRTLISLWFYLFHLFNLVMTHRPETWDQKKPLQPSYSFHWRDILKICSRADPAVGPDPSQPHSRKQVRGFWRVRNFNYTAVKHRLVTGLASVICEEITGEKKRKGRRVGHVFKRGAEWWKGDLKEGKRKKSQLIFTTRRICCTLYVIRCACSCVRERDVSCISFSFTFLVV